MEGLNRDLQSYYEREAELGRRGPLGGRRVSARAEFIDLLKKERRTSVLDLGAGPGRDGEGFVAADLTCVGLDLAHGNALLSATKSIPAVQASLDAPPFARSSFDAGWSMSTFMHIPEASAAGTARAMVSPLIAGAPMLVGLWGGDRRDEIEEDSLIGERRLFSLRTAEHNGRLLSGAGTIEAAEIWDVGPDGWEYQVFLVRVKAPAIVL